MTEEAGVRYENPPELASPLGAYSHVARTSCSEVVAIAGQVAVDRHGTVVGENDCVRQTEQAFANVRIALESAGLTPGDVVEYTTYLVDENDIERFFAGRDKIFQSLYPDGKYPPNTLLVVKRLVRPELRVEIRALAAHTSHSGR